jgi:HK97 family phage major capsid protein
MQRVLAIRAKAESEDRALTSSETRELERVLDMAEESREHEKRIKAMSDELGAPGAVTSEFGDPRSGGPGDIFVKSAEFKKISDPESRPQKWSIGPVEVSSGPMMTKGTLLEGSQSPGTGTGGGLIPSPMVESGVVQTLFQPLSVLDLLPKSQTSTSVVRYMLEGTAVSGAAGVAEGASKPESTLGVSTVDEQVRKIATSITVSDELLEDAVQVQSYINSRLSLFVSLEQERQVLRGTGSGANELLGLFGRSINTYNIGADTPAVGIYKAIVNTRGSANLAPTAIVMHPVNYANIRRGTATTGEYLAGYPIGSSSGSPGIYQDNLWGLPVALSTTVGAGTALLGAFDSAARLYTRGGVSVEATNSHGDLFVKNLVALRAESRQALAVFRPGAFTSVTGLGTSI